MFRIAICDDETVFLDLEKRIIEEHLNSFDLEFKVDAFSSGRDLLEKEDNGSYDLIMLDVEMPEIDGMTVAGRLREKKVLTPIAFVSAYINYSTDGYHVQAVRYILKNQRIGMYIEECLDHILKVLDLNNRVIDLEFSIGRRRINVNDILYLQSEGNYTNYIMEGSVEICRRKIPIKRATKDLAHCDFIQISAKESVNLHRVESVGRYSVLLDNGVKLDISQKRYNDVLIAFTLYERGKDL